MLGKGNAVGGSTKSSRCKYDLMDCTLCTSNNVCVEEEMECERSLW